MTRITPRNALVTVRKVDAGERKTASGLIIPHTQGMVFELCEVVAVGRGYPQGDSRLAENADHRAVFVQETDTDDLAPGMLVLAKLGMRQAALGQIAYSSIPLTDDLGEIFILNQSDIVAIVEDAKPETHFAD